MELAQHEKCEFIPFMTPKKVHVENNRIIAIEFKRMEETSDGVWEEQDDILYKKADYVISAFGSQLSDEKGRVLSLLAVYPLAYDKKESIRFRFQLRMPWLR